MKKRTKSFYLQRSEQIALARKEGAHHVVSWMRSCKTIKEMIKIREKAINIELNEFDPL